VEIDGSRGRPSPGPLNTSRDRLKRLIIGVNVILVLALVAGFLYYADPRSLLGILKTVSLPWFLLAVASNAFTTVFVSMRLWIMIRKQGILIPLFELVRVNLGVRFYSFFSPISSVGTVMRWIRLIPADKSAGGLAALAANRVFDVLLALSMGVLWALSSINLHNMNALVIVAYLVLLLLALWVILRAGDPIAAWADRLAGSPTSRMKAWVFRNLGKVFHALALYRSFTRAELLTLLGAALVGELVSLLAYVLIGWSVNLPISFVDLGWIRAILLLVALTPITLPGGFGIREVSAIALVTALGVSVEQAAAFSILLYLRSVFMALVGGLVEVLFNMRTIRTGFSG
jgi:uncharacterized protein (TIRG00374 family)